MGASFLQEAFSKNFKSEAATTSFLKTDERKEKKRGSAIRSETFKFLKARDKTASFVPEKFEQKLEWLRKSAILNRL